MDKLLFNQAVAEWASAALVFISGAAAGHCAQQGMTEPQWLGAAVAILGSITVAVAVRVWPAQDLKEG